jgi:uncharacterized membrane protein (GlpM family)
MQSGPLTSTQIIILTCAPLLMVVVSLFERRWGPRIAGLVAAAPFTALVGLLLVHSDLGAQASHEMALDMSGYVPAQIGVAVVVVALVGRIGYLPSLLLGIASYACLAVLAAHLPVEVAVAASLLLLVVGQRLVRAPVETDTTGETGGEEQSKVTAGPLMITLRAVVSLATALGLLLAAQAFGPAAGGAIGAFPILTFTLCSFIVAASGQLGVRRVLAGMVQGLPPYFAFVLTYGLTVTHLGALVGSTAAGLICASCYLAIAWRGGRRGASRRGRTPPRRTSARAELSGHRLASRSPEVSRSGSASAAQGRLLDTGEQY